MAKATRLARSGPYITVSQLAERLSVARSTAYGLVSAGKLPALRVGSSWRIPLADLERWERAKTTGVTG